MQFFQKLGANRFTRLRLATNTLYQVIARIVSSGVSFLITILVARHFGVSAYGDFAKVTAFVTMFYLLADFGLNAMFLQKEKSSEHFHDLFYSRIFLSIILIVLVNAIAFFLPYNPQTGIGFSPFVRGAIALFSFTIFTESILYSAFATFQRRFIYERFMLATIIGSSVTLFLVGIFILLGFSFWWVFAGFVIGGIVEATCSLVLIEEKLLPITIHTQFVRELFFSTLPVATMLVFNLVYFRIDTFLLSLFRPSADVGIYDVSYRVFDFLIALPLFLSNVLYPRLLQEEKNKRNGITKIALYVFHFFGLGILVALPFWFVSQIIFISIKPALFPAVVPFRLLLLSLPIFFATNILQWILLTKKQQIFLAGIYGVLTIVNVILNLLFIPHFGYVASAIITDVGELVVLCALGVRIFIES